MNIISEKQVKESIDLEKAFAAIEKSYQDYSSGRTQIPETTSMSVNDGMFYSFPAYLQESPIFISKQATDYRRNREKGLPTVHPYILVFDSKTGILNSIIEARHFAAIRTSLSSAVGVKHLARKKNILAIFGSGVQGKAHARILTKLFPEIKEVRMHSPTREHLEASVSELAGEIKITAAKSAKEAVLGADIIVTATTSSNPVFDAKDVSEHALIIGVGAMKKDQEVPEGTVGNAQVIVDSEQNIPMYDEIKLAKGEGYDLGSIVELGQTISDPSLVGAEGVIVFKHHGPPATDAALAETIISN